MEVLTALGVVAALTLVKLTTRSSIFGLFIITFFVGADVIPDFLVLLEKQPEHTI